jgi:hypothetical protein
LWVRGCTDKEEAALNGLGEEEEEEGLQEGEEEEGEGQAAAPAAGVSKWLAGQADASKAEGAGAEEGADEGADGEREGGEEDETSDLFLQARQMKQAEMEREKEREEEVRVCVCLCVFACAGLVGWSTQGKGGVSWHVEAQAR